MRNQPIRPDMAVATIGFAVLFIVTLACARSMQPDKNYWSVSGSGPPAATNRGLSVPSQAGGGLQVAATRTPGGPILTPTPDEPHRLPPLRSAADTYIVQPGDTLGIIAGRYGVSLQQLIAANDLQNPDILLVGVQLNIPAPTPEGPGPDFKIVPDSELVFSPATASLDVAAFIQAKGGYLNIYSEEVDGKPASGAQVVDRVAREFSVNPRLLLAVLEYQSGWVTQPKPAEAALEYPLGLVHNNYKGLYRQLSWAANNLNRGYYLWKANGVGTWLLADQTVMRIAPTINAGTAGVQQMFALLLDRENWQKAVSPQGVYATYSTLFGFPFDYALEPLQPAGLVQPVLQLPFEMGKQWAFTGGPHGGWGDGSAWAALDFAPPGEATGCFTSEDWVTAVADGLILRTGTGVVIQDLDGDGLEQTGWVLLYMHIESRQRIQAGKYVKAGELIGHPSCEGGLSNGTHVHLARRYNGEWIAADQAIPFVMDGWTSHGVGHEYDGYLQKGSEKVVAYAGRATENLIQR